MAPGVSKAIVYETLKFFVILSKGFLYIDQGGRSPQSTVFRFMVLVRGSLGRSGAVGATVREESGEAWQGRQGEGGSFAGVGVVSMDRRLAVRGQTPTPKGKY